MNCYAILKKLHEKKKYIKHVSFYTILTLCLKKIIHWSPYTLTCEFKIIENQFIDCDPVQINLFNSTLNTQWTLFKIIKYYIFFTIMLIDT